MDDLKPTMKELNIDKMKPMQVLPVDQHKRPIDISYLNTTQKEINETLVRPNFVIPNNQSQTTHLTDPTKTTIREISEGITRISNIMPTTQNRTTDISDFNSTMREIIDNTCINQFIAPVDQYKQKTFVTDPTKTTNRETISTIPTNKNISTNSKRPIDISNLNSTMKETIEQINRPSFIAPVNQTKQTAHYSDELKTTMKETMNNSNFTTITNNIGSRIPYSDIAKTTNRETLIDIPYNSYISGNSRGKTDVFDGNPLKTTMRESTTEKSIPIIIDNSNQGMKSNLFDIARTTMKEITSNSIIGNIFGVDRSQRAPDPEIVKTTMKELNIDIPYSTQITGNEKGKGYSFNADPLKTTIKETVSNNDRVNQAFSNKNSGYLIENMIVPETHRQDTCIKTRINPLNGISKSTINDSYYNSIVNHKNKKIHVYRPPTTCNVFMGPNAENLHYKLRDDSSYSLISNPYKENTVGRLRTHFALRDDSKDISDRFINPKLLKQLESNPYNIDVNN
jgi:hypothetical protein